MFAVRYYPWLTILIFLAFALEGYAQGSRNIYGRIHLDSGTVSEENWQQMEKAATISPEAFVKMCRKLYGKGLTPPRVEVTARQGSISKTVLSGPDGKYLIENVYGVYTVSARTPTTATVRQPHYESITFSVRAVENNAMASIEIYPSLVTIRGTVRDGAGRPISGAKVTGSPRPLPEALGHVMEDVTTITDDKGLYELTGFPPVTSLYRIAGYLNEGSLRTQFDFSTYAEIRVKAEGYLQPADQVREIPLITESYLPAGRRFLRILASLTTDSETDLPKDIGEKEGVFLPASMGTTITDIDILLTED